MKALSALERGRATSKLLRHPKLSPYVSKMAPHLPQLAPHAQRILDHLEDHLNPHMPILIGELPRLLMHLGPLLEEVPYLSPYLHKLLLHRDHLLPCLDRIAPHMPSLRPHLNKIVCHLPTIAPYVRCFAPFLAALLPHLEALLNGLPALEPHLEDLTSDDLLPLLAPHVGAFAANISSLAPHLPALRRALRSEQHLPPDEQPLHAALPAIFASLPVLLPHFGQVIGQASRLGDRLSSLCGRPMELIDELRAHAPTGFYTANGAVAAVAAGEGSSSSSSRSNAAPKEKEADDGGGWLGGLLRFFGGDDGSNAEAPAEAEPVADVAKVNAAIVAASKRISALEADFVACKQAHATHLSHEHDAAVRCARLEALLADVDEGLVKLGRKTVKLGDMVEEAEEQTGAEPLMHARESRQIELINGRRDGLYAPPAWEGQNPSSFVGGGGMGTLDVAVNESKEPPLQHASPAPVVQQAQAAAARRRSLMTAIEDDWLAKLAL